MSRVQLALNVDNLDESISFYSKLFNTEPAKIKPGYANFAVAEPPLKLVLMENPGQGGSINHLGVEVADVDTVDAEQTRLADDGLRLDRRARHHLLLRQAGQVLGRGRAQRRTVGDLHRPRRLRDLLRRADRRHDLLRDRACRRRASHFRGQLLLRLTRPRALAFGAGNDDADTDDAHRSAEHVVAGRPKAIERHPPQERPGHEHAAMRGEHATEMRIGLGRGDKSVAAQRDRTTGREPPGSRFAYRLPDQPASADLRDGSNHKQQSRTNGGHRSAPGSSSSKNGSAAPFRTVIRSSTVLPRKTMLKPRNGQQCCSAAASSATRTPSPLRTWRPRRADAGLRQHRPTSRATALDVPRDRFRSGSTRGWRRPRPGNSCQASTLGLGASEVGDSSRNAHDGSRA